MSPVVVTSKFVWSDYPGLRPGRLYAGKPDLFKRPKGEAHLLASPDAAETLCGIPRAQFPHDFPDAAESIDSSRYAELCATCRDRNA